MVFVYYKMEHLEIETADDLTLGMFECINSDMAMLPQGELADEHEKHVEPLSGWPRHRDEWQDQ